MFKFFDSIISTIEYFIYFLCTMLESVELFFKQIISGIMFVFESIAWLPPFCKGILFAVVGVSILTALISSFVEVG